eukprot:TRINITY_DN18096_c0_g1_i2.p1 TRINITY_DN18096_c0_g1~~TRINITY_DN18096_c0_g1_i2.p1  ORF type:complete len:431 (-),score=53.06 TRINITY_DN18096_c0_g1_i2:491-1783(-)
MKLVEYWNAYSVIHSLFFIAIVWFELGNGNMLAQQQTSIQIFQNLEIFRNCKDPRIAQFGLGEDGMYRSYGRRLQQSESVQEECSQIKRDLLSNALIGQCNVTNPHQLLALSDLELQNCCSYASKMITQQCFQPCSQDEQLFEAYGLATFWVAYCEVEYSCNQLTKSLPGNYSLAAVPSVVQEDSEEGMMAAAVLTPAAQSQLHALASVHVSSARTYDDSSHNDRFATLSNTQVVENIQEEVGQQYPRLSDEALQQIVATGLPTQVLDRSIMQNLNLMPDLSFTSQAINQLPNISQHLAQNNGKTYTLFAPTDQAFLDLARTLGVEVQSLSSLSSWSSIMKSLIVPGEHSLLSVQPGDKLQSLVPGAEIFWEHSILRQSIVLKGCCDPLNAATLILGEIRMANGILHVIDKVILPPDAPFTPQDVHFIGN